MDIAPNPALYVLEPPLTRAAVLGELAAMPSNVRVTIEGATHEALTRSSPGAWSAFQVLCHLRDAALVYSSRFRWIVFNDNPHLTSYDEDRWVTQARDELADIPAILDEIAASRADLVRVLTRIDDASWKRTGRHDEAGILVLEHYVPHELVHERMHLDQLRTALNGAGV